MRLTILIAVFLLFHSFALLAQNRYSVKGSVVDSTAKAKLLNASISVLNAKDSILIKFTRASEKGDFNIGNLKKGKFLLLITYPGYADYVEHFNLDSVNQAHDFGAMTMTLKSKLLADVIIKAKVAAIKIKGDTTEFNAGSFVVQPNAKVEDLLKQLPGIEIDRNGKITAQGQTVNKVLVDGEEFFGDDPTLVTKNLRADMVDKVQLYDKKSDQAAFTGIDDGKKEKTINIKLKEDKKNGYFGKADGERGSDQYYQGQLLFNRFKAKQKISIYGIASNTGKTGLGWEDANKYGSSNDDVTFGDDGGVNIISNGNDDLEAFDGRYNGEGLPAAKTGGVHYDTKLKGDNQSINTNYKVGYLGVVGSRNAQTVNSLVNGIIANNSDESYNNSIFRQKVDLTYKIKIDTTSNLKIFVSGGLSNSKTTSTTNASSFSGDTLLNNNKRTLSNNVDHGDFDGNVFWTKKLKKKGRTMSLNVSETYRHDDSKGYLNSLTNFYHTASKADSIAKIDQYKTSDIHSSVLNSNFTYSEPFSKSFSLIVNYGLGFNHGTSDRKSFDASAPGKYNLLDSALSNNYNLNQLTNELGTMFNYAKGKTLLNFGTKITRVNFDQLDDYTDISYKRTFVNWRPQARFTYKISQQQAISLEYNGNTTQPTIYQIQPVRINTNPLNIAIGNPSLRPSFTNSFTANYNSYKVISQQYMYFYAYYALIGNEIATNVNTDLKTGKSSTQAVNISGSTPYNLNLHGDFGQKIDILGGITISGNLSADNAKSYNYINNVLNTSSSLNFTMMAGLNKNKEKKYDVYVAFGPNLAKTRSSLQPQTNSDGGGSNGYARFVIYLPGKFEVESDADYTYRAPTQNFNTSFSKLIWNSYIAKTFLKSDNLKVMVTGNDLLNQNQGFNRYVYGNTIAQNTNTTIKRYFMLSVVWDFNKMGLGTDKK